MIDSCFTVSESSEWDKWQTVDESQAKEKTYDNKNEKRNVRHIFFVTSFLTKRIFLFSAGAGFFFGCVSLCRLLCRLFMKLLRRASGDIRLPNRNDRLLMPLHRHMCCTKTASYFGNAFCGISPNLFSIAVFSLPIGIRCLFVILLRLFA